MNEFSRDRWSLFSARANVAITSSLLLVVTVQVCWAEQKTPVMSFEQAEEKVTIRIDGELFTEYLTQSGTRPVLWPIIGPTGEPMTRAYPDGTAREMV